jgi:hypothetical protein
MPGRSCGDQVPAPGKGDAIVRDRPPDPAAKATVTAAFSLARSEKRPEEILAAVCPRAGTPSRARAGRPSLPSPLASENRVHAPALRRASPRSRPPGPRRPVPARRLSGGYAALPEHAFRERRHRARRLPRTVARLLRDRLRRRRGGAEVVQEAHAEVVWSYSDPGRQRRHDPCTFVRVAKWFAHSCPPLLAKLR